MHAEFFGKIRLSSEIEPMVKISSALINHYNFWVIVTIIDSVSGLSWWSFNTKQIWSELEYSHYTLHLRAVVLHVGENSRRYAFPPALGHLRSPFVSPRLPADTLVLFVSVVLVPSAPIPNLADRVSEKTRGGGLRVGPACTGSHLGPGPWTPSPSGLATNKSSQITIAECLDNFFPYCWLFVT